MQTGSIHSVSCHESMRPPPLPRAAALLWPAPGLRRIRAGRRKSSAHRTTQHSTSKGNKQHNDTHAYACTARCPFNLCSADRVRRGHCSPAAACLQRPGALVSVWALRHSFNWQGGACKVDNKSKQRREGEHAAMLCLCSLTSQRVRWPCGLLHLRIRQLRGLIRAAALCITSTDCSPTRSPHTATQHTSSLFPSHVYERIGFRASLPSHALPLTQPHVGSRPCGPWSTGTGSQIHTRIRPETRRCCRWRSQQWRRRCERWRWW
jgi:hypothetical protein